MYFKFGLEMVAMTYTKALKSNDTWEVDCLPCFRLLVYILENNRFKATLGPYSLTWIKLSEKSAQDQIRIKENGSADLWLKSVFTKEESAEPKKLKNFT